MNTDTPKPDTTLSTKDLALFRATDKAAKDGVLGERVRKLVRIIRELDAKLFKLQNDDRHSYRGKALQQAEIITELSLKNAALTERLRVAEGRIARVEALQAKAPYGLFTYGASGDYEQGIADYAELLRAAIAATSAAAPKEAT